MIYSLIELYPFFARYIGCIIIICRGEETGIFDMGKRDIETFKRVGLLAPLQNPFKILLLLQLYLRTNTLIYFTSILSNFKLGFSLLKKIKLLYFLCYQTHTCNFFLKFSINFSSITKTIY